MTTLSSRFCGVIDTTLRDGQQSPLLFDSGKYRFSREDKEQIFTSLVRLGVRHFEFFAPVVSAAEYEDVQALRRLASKLTDERIHFLAHCRCHADDIASAIDHGFDGLNLYIGIHELARQHSHGFSLNRILSLVADLLRRTRADYPDLLLRFSIEDCFRTPLEDIYTVYDTIAPSVDILGMPDTVGIATPEDVRERIRALKTRYPDAALECHFHNDRGYALVNATTAVLAGAEYIDASVWGLAERSGITSVTGLLLNLAETDPNLTNRYQLELAYPVNVTMGSILQWHVPYTEPVSITNRTHTAGVHQKAVLNNTEVYEGHQLEKFGVTAHQLLLGPLSGWNLIFYYLREIAAINITRDQAKDVAREFKSRVVSMSRTNSPEQALMRIVEERGYTRLPVPPPEALPRLENVTVHSASPIQ